MLPTDDRLREDEETEPDLPLLREYEPRVDLAGEPKEALDGDGFTLTDFDDVVLTG